MATINVVPYIDVMLVLLVIFMITTPLLSQGVHVDLPNTSAKPLTAQKAPIIVSVDAKGLYYLNTAAHPEMALDAPDLAAQVKTTLQDDKTHNRVRPVLLKADASIHYGQVMQVMVLLQQAGVPGVGLVTHPPQNTKNSA